MELAFQKERCRVDRNGRGCALVAFQIVHSGAKALERVSDMLRSRCRLSDTLGQLDAHLLVALLPETSGEKAWTVAEDVRDQAREQGLEVHCEVYCYPKDWLGGVPSPNGSAGSTGSSGSNGNGTPARLRDRVARSGAKPLARAVGARGSQGGLPESTRRRAEEETTVLSVGDLGPAAELAPIETERPVGDLRPLMLHPTPPWKRGLDIAVSGVLIVLLSPLFFVVGLAIKATSEGPIIFRQKRVGEGGRVFTFYKFRSMYKDAEQRKKELESQNEAEGPVFKIKNDPRLTAIGKILRSTSVDELPQLWNVFKGDMTLVGPRPPTTDEVPRYELWQLHRLATRGGITCIWQVSGRSDIKFLEWARMDLRYLATKSFWTDLTLLWRTMSAVWSRKGAY